MLRRILPTLLIVALISCAPKKDTNTTTKVDSVHPYSEPRFSDPASFERLKDHFSLLDQLFSDYARENHFPSIAYGLVVGNELVYSGATGVTNVSTNAPATTEHLYRIASMSKSFTAMAILKLRDEGKLSLADPVSKYVPEFAGSGTLTKDSGPITLLHLLTMSAGFPEDNPWGDRQLADADQELLDHVKGGVSFSNAPGLAYEYSNMGFALLGKTISNVSGQPYQKYITENIMAPIGMTHSKWEYTEVPNDDLALGYRWEDGTWKEEPMLHDGVYGAMGGLICSIEDFAKYVSLHLSAWPPRDEDEHGPVRRSSLREMHQPWRVNSMFPQATNRSGKPCPIVAGYGYGLGWRQDCNGTVRVAHSGGLPGFGSHWAIYPEYNIGIISFANHTYGAPGLPNMVALDTLIQLAGLKKRELPPSNILKQRRDEIVKFLPEWKEGDAAIFAENFYMDADLAHRQEEVRKIFTEAGDVLEVTNVIPENQLRGTFTIRGSKKDVKVFFTLTPEAAALVQQLDFSIEEKPTK